MPYYTFNISSLNKTVLTKQFTTKDCIDLHLLLASEDFEGVDLFCEKKFAEYTDNKDPLTNLDKFLYLFSQKILSHNYKITVNHVTKSSKDENKLSIIIDLAKIYSSIISTSFIFKESYINDNLKIEYGLPLNLSSKELISVYNVYVDNNKVEFEGDVTKEVLNQLPFEANKQINKFIVNNNNLIKSDYFKKCFLKNLELTNECLLYILDFIYTENLGNYLNLCFNLNKEYNINYEHINTITMRELQLIVETINNINKEKKSQQKANERFT